MTTVLYYNDQLPATGTPVTVVVDNANHPTGIWLGVIGSYAPCGEKDLPGENSAQCEVILTDPRLSNEWRDKSPTVNSTAYLETQGTRFLRNQLAIAETQVASLHDRLKIEREVYHGLMRAVIGNTGLENLKTVLLDMIGKVRK